MAEIRVCRTDEIADGNVRIVTSGDLEIGVIREKGRFFAYRNVCPHQGGPVCEGLKMPGVEDRVGDGGLYLGQTFNEDDIHIVCPWHGYEFHLEDGTNVCDARLKLKKFDVVEREGVIYVAL